MCIKLTEPDLSPAHSASLIFQHDSPIWSSNLCYGGISLTSIRQLIRGDYDRKFCRSGVSNTVRRERVDGFDICLEYTG